MRIFALIALLATPVHAAPERVVSMNLCTDQLAMLLAAPGQLVSVSWLARDPRSSGLAEQARAYIPNRGQAEQIFQMQPDLVLASPWTAQAPLDLLRRLGVRVEIIPEAERIEDVPAAMQAVARALGRGSMPFDVRMAAPKGTAATYAPNGYTAGPDTLADDILRHGGYRNIGSGGVMPLEMLVLAAPDLIVTPAPYGVSRAEEVLTHPALAAIPAQRALSSADWVCGTPLVQRAIANLP